MWRCRSAEEGHGEDQSPTEKERPQKQAVVEVLVRERSIPNKPAAGGGTLGFPVLCGGGPADAPGLSLSWRRKLAAVCRRAATKHPLLGRRRFLRLRDDGREGALGLAVTVEEQRLAMGAPGVGVVRPPKRDDFHLLVVLQERPEEAQLFPAIGVSRLPPWAAGPARPAAAWLRSRRLQHLREQRVILPGH